MSDAGEDISNDMEGLKNAMKNGNDTVKTDMRQISDQFQKIMDLLFDEIEDLRNGEDQDDIFIDASDEEISRTKQGKIANSRNFGAVEGDRNAGGIVGVMSIDLVAGKMSHNRIGFNFYYRESVLNNPHIYVVFLFKLNILFLFKY